jgi:hypothetical protein
VKQLDVVLLKLEPTITIKSMKKITYQILKKNGITTSVRIKDNINMP